VSGKCDIKWGIFKEFNDKFGFFTYIGKFSPFGNHLFLVYGFCEPVVLIRHICSNVVCVRVYCILPPCGWHLIYVFIGQMSYGSMFVFLWVAGVIRDDRIGGGRFPIYTECEYPVLY
jgi:hypothetical protein